jgi:ArsR family transcriptional regulator, arsenate/arsenite/antimonite-responsive transcriptional repressor
MDETEAVEAINALSQLTRLRIMRLLADAPHGLPAGEIAASLGVRQNTLSSHIAILERCGLIDGERKGRSIIYAMDRQRAHQIVNELNEALGVSAWTNSPRSKPSAGSWK